VTAHFAATSRSAARVAVAAPLAATLVLLGAGTASAHVEATAGDGAQAGAGPVTVAFVAEAESTTAGIINVKTQLPAGVLPEWVSLASGPDGWALSTDGDSYTVGGPGLPAGTDAEFTIGIGQLPADRTEFTFKSLVRYSDNHEDAWIQEQVPGGDEPENPAPTITVAQAVAPATTAAASSSPAASAAPATSPATSAAVTPTTSAQASDEQGTPSWLIVVGVLAVVAVAGGLVYWRSRSRA
jgi:hypothetical protein